MRRVPLEPVRAAFAVALVAATLAFALAILAGPWLLVVLATCALPFFEWTSVPASLVRTLPRAVGLLLLATGALAWLSRSMGALILDESLFTRVAGPLLLASAIVFSLAPRRFPPGRTLLPATIGLLAVSGLDPRPEGYGPTALGFLKGSEHTAFAERYLALAILVLLALWTGAFLTRGPRWSARATAGLALTVLVAAALAALGIVGLPLFQPHVERAFASAFADGSTGLGGESRLGEFAALAVSHRRVLDLETSLPEGGAWKLPSQVFTEFDGHGWKDPAAKTPPRSTALRPAPAALATSPLLEGLGSWFLTGPADAPGAVEMRVTQAEVHDWPLFAPRGTRAVTAPAYVLSLDPYGLVRRPAGDATRLYGMLWFREPLTERALELTRDERDASLALPPRVDPRLAALARQLSVSDGPRAQLDAVVQHLQTGYRYTLSPGDFHSDDALAEFLFEKKAGYCEYFATAAVMLLRLQGVPSRYVKGLAVGPHTDQGGGLHVVRESAAHAWVEAYVPGEGWVEADPTPPGDFMAMRPRASLFSRLVEHARAALASAWTRLSVRGPLELLRWLSGRAGAAAGKLVREPLAWLLLAALVLGRLGLRLVPRLRRRAGRRAAAADASVPADLRALVRALERRWAAAGSPRPAGRGLLEHARRLAAGHETPRPLAASAAAAGPPIVEAYYRARFGGRPPNPDELSRLRGGLEGQRP